jgi:hypothetical protein
MITAFGETKHVDAWPHDSRCNVSDGKTILRRLNRAGMSPEDAISTPIGSTPRMALEITAFGETKSLTEWLKDERCKVGRSALISRMDLGWKGEDILSLPAGCSPSTAVYAFGEVMSIQQWARHPKCGGIGPEGLRHRIDDGMDPEEAITTPPGHKTGAGVVTAWGERKLLSQWEDDPRCSGVKGTTIAQRIRSGMSAEDAISKPPTGGSRMTIAERFERYLQTPYKPRKIKISLFQDAAARVSENVQFSNMYTVDEVHFCFGVWVDAADALAFGHALGQVAAEAPADEAKRLAAMLPKGKPTVTGSGTLYLFEGWRAVTDSGQAWRDE